MFSHSIPITERFNTNLRDFENALKYKHIGKCSVNNKTRFICQRMKRVCVNKFLEEMIFEKPTPRQRCFHRIELGRRDECIKLYRISIRWPKGESSDILHEECDEVVC